MPRGKTPMSLIGNARTRMSTFARRKEGLVKKARELSTLCGVDVAVVHAGPGGGGAPSVWESKDGVIRRYRALPPEKRREHTHLNYVKEEVGKEKAKLARVRQAGPLALAPWADALDGGVSPEELLRSIDAALLATEERRKALGLPDADDGDQLLRIASDALLAPCGGDGFDGVDGWGEELIWDGGAQPMDDAFNANVMQPAPGVLRYINGGSVNNTSGSQYTQLQMPGNGNNNNLGQFAWDAYQSNAAAHHQFTDSNCTGMQLQSFQMQVAANANASRHNDWLDDVGMRGFEKSSSCHAFTPGNSEYGPAEQCTPCIGDNFTGAPGNFMDVNGNEYETQCLTDDLQCPYAGQDFGLHYLSDVADGFHFRH